MRMPDVNILIYAHRAEEAAHAGYRRWLEALVNGPEPFALSLLVAVGFVRIVTNPRVYPTPTPLAAALGFIESLGEHPRCRLTGPGPRHLRLVADLARAARSTGKAVADAQHAALAIEHGCTWVTRDGDFARFSGLGLVWQHLVLPPPAGAVAEEASPLRGPSSRRRRELPAGRQTRRRLPGGAKPG